MLPVYRVLWVLAVHDATQPAHRLTVREVMQAGRWGAVRALEVGPSVVVSPNTGRTATRGKSVV